MRVVEQVTNPARGVSPDPAIIEQAAAGMPVYSAAWAALGTSVQVVATDRHHLEAVVAEVQEELALVDACTSRFRADSELSMVEAKSGSWVDISETLFDYIEVALWAARLTHGAVDPTVGNALCLLGYDLDFDLLEKRGPAGVLRVRPVPGWEAVRLDASGMRMKLPGGVHIDLGATAKARCADRAAARAAARTGSGVLVSLGGDIATAGPAPAGGWTIEVREGPEVGGSEDLVVAIKSGGVATSSVTGRRWARGDSWAHHVIDPATGLSTDGPWRTVTVAANRCLDANIASTAALVMGYSALSFLGRYPLPARLVAQDGAVTTVSGWPREPQADRPRRWGSIDAS